jgi:hypothetical protein
MKSPPALRPYCRDRPDNQHNSHYPLGKDLDP